MNALAAFGLLMVAIALVAAWQCGYEIGERAGAVRGGHRGFLHGRQAERREQAMEACEDEARPLDEDPDREVNRIPPEELQ